MADHVDVVARIKGELVAAGVDLSGPCGAFQITKRVAWELRQDGYGLVAKTPPQNNCQGYGVDVVMFQNGDCWDILINSETENISAWNKTGSQPPSAWRAPIDPGDTQPGPTPPTPTPDLAEVLRKLDELTTAVNLGLRLGEKTSALLSLVSEDMDMLVDRKPPVYKGKLFGMTVTLTPEVQ
jgi:hypothetical protein